MTTCDQPAIVLTALDRISSKDVILTVNQYNYISSGAGRKTVPGRKLSGVIAFLLLGLLSTASAQLATVGAGILTSRRSPEPVFELHAASPPFAQTRAYITLSWTESSSQPTVISAAERTILHPDFLSAGFGAGLLWLEANEYKPYPMLVSSTVVPLPLPRTSFVLIASTLPFEDFDWSVVFKIGVTLFFVR